MGWVSRVGVGILLISSGCDERVSESGVERTFVEQGFDRGIIAVASARRLSQESLWGGKPSERGDNHPDQKVVQVFGNSEYCPACKKFQTWWNGLSERERSELPVRFAYREDSIPEFAAEWGRPAFYWEGQPGKYWKQEGWSGVEDFLKNYHGSQ